MLRGLRAVGCAAVRRAGQLRPWWHWWLQGVHILVSWLAARAYMKTARSSDRVVASAVVSLTRRAVPARLMR